MGVLTPVTLHISVSLI